MIIKHIDTCLPCYLLDHCNGDTEQLIAVYVTSSSRYHDVKAELIREIMSNGDKITDEESAIVAINQAFCGIHPFKTWDRSLEKISPEDDNGESVYSYFCFSWES